MHDYNECPPTEYSATWVEITTRIFKTFPITIAYVRFPSGAVWVETRIRGVCIGKGFPKYGAEATALRAIEAVQ